MKKISFFWMLLLTFNACKKLEDPVKNPSRGKSFLKFVHANPIAPALDLYSNYYNQTNKIGSEITHKKSLPSVGYMQLQSSDTPTSTGVGTYWFHTRPSQTQDTFHTPIPILLEKDQYQTLFSIDSAGKPKLILFQDKFQKPDSGFALVRFFNGKMDSGNLTLASDNSQTPSVNFMQISDFQSFSINNVNFYLKDANGNTLHSITNYPLKNRQVYTFFYSDSLYVTQQSE